MDLGLDGRVFLLTGATTGLGRATAEVLLAEGARVVLSGRHADSVAGTVDSLEAGSAAGRMVGVTADNADPDTPRRLVEAARSTWSRLDGALVSVGGPPGGTLMDTPDETWSQAFESVLLGGLRLGREIGRELGDGGALAFVLSSSVKAPIAGLAVSNGLRPGLAMVAKNLADELGPRGVRVNGLLPGRIDTDRVRHLDGLADDPAAARAAGERSIPLRRYGRAEEFGRAAAFLLSPAASFVSGVMLPVDGGLLRSL